METRGWRFCLHVDLLNSLPVPEHNTVTWVLEDPDRVRMGGSNENKHYKCNKKKRYINRIIQCQYYILSILDGITDVAHNTSTPTSSNVSLVTGNCFSLMGTR